MVIALYVVSIIWIALGTFLIVYTEGTRGVLRKVFLTNNVRWIAVFPLLFGVILGVGAFYSGEMFWLVITLGAMALLKGIYLIAAPTKQVNGLLEWWFNRAGEPTIRLFGLIAFTLGSAVLSYL